MRERFIIGGSPELIRTLAEVIKHDPEMKLIEIAGPANKPERIVAIMPTQRADIFRQTLGNQVKIDVDHEIQPFT